MGIADAAGNFFGEAANGGAYNDGTVFEIANTSGGYASTPTILFNFDGPNGSHPVGSLVADTAGNLFGTTISGGTNNDGAVFEIAKTDMGYVTTPTVLVNLDASAWYPVDYGGLIVDSSGDLFGTTAYGGTYNQVTVFEIAKTSAGYASTPTVLASLDGERESFSTPD